MLKHILTGQPSSVAGSKYLHHHQHHHHHNDYQATIGVLPSPSGSQQQQPQQQQQNASLQSDHNHHHHHYVTSGRHAVSAVRAASSDVYDSMVHSPVSRAAVPQFPQRTTAATPSSVHRHPLNHSQSSVNNLSQRLNGTHHSQALNLSILSASKHSVNSVSPVVVDTTSVPSNGKHHQHHIQLTQDHRPKVNGGLDISRLDISRLSRLPSQTTPSPAPVHMPVASAQGATASATASAIHQPPSVIPMNTSWSSSLSRHQKMAAATAGHEPGVKEMLTSLGLLCLVSLLLALLSLVFLLKISPLTVTPSSLISPEEYAVVYEVTLALCALALSLNLCCLLVCAIQFLFTVKLVKSAYHGYRTNKYLQKSSISRVCAVGGFFISIPVFLTGMILYTFIQFHSTPAIVTSILIGLGILFCGCAMVHNVFVWQREKTNAIKALAREQYETAAQLQRQQNQQQQQQHQRPVVPSLHQSIYTGKNDSTMGARIQGSQCLQQQHQQQQLSSSYHQLNQQQQQHSRRISVSPPPPLLLATTHSHQNISSPTSHRVVPTVATAATTTTMSPPTTPGEHSPPSPSNRHNRSQHLLQREAAGSVSPGLPTATLDLSSAATTNSPHELSTLV